MVIADPGLPIRHRSPPDRAGMGDGHPFLVLQLCCSARSAARPAPHLRRSRPLRGDRRNGPAVLLPARQRTDLGASIERLAPVGRWSCRRARGPGGRRPADAWGGAGRPCGGNRPHPDPMDPRVLAESDGAVDRDAFFSAELHRSTAPYRVPGRLRPCRCAQCGVRAPVAGPRARRAPRRRSPACPWMPRCRSTP